MMMIPACQFVRQVAVLKMKRPDYAATGHLLQGAINGGTREAWKLAACAQMHLYGRKVSACPSQDVEDDHPL